MRECMEFWSYAAWRDALASRPPYVSLTDAEMEALSDFSVRGIKVP